MEIKQERKAFVVMPFHDPYNSYYQAVFVPALSNAGYKAVRGDDMFTPHPIMLDIQREICESDLILCEMSERNSNVFYELGLAHAIGKPAILISRKEEDIPFDLRHIRVIIYDYTRAGWEAKLLNDITAAARSIDESKEPWPTPIVKLYSQGRGSNAPRAVSPPAINRPINLRFDGPVVGNKPFGWFNSVGFVSQASPYYESNIVRHSNGVYLRFENPSQTDYEFGSLMQRCPAAHLAGKTIRFEGEVKTEGVTNWCGLWFRADSDESPNLFFDNMARRPIYGTTEWKSYLIDAQLPIETTWINYGIVLSGRGAMLVANLRLAYWDNSGRWVDV